MSSHVLGGCGNPAWGLKTESVLQSETTCGSWVLGHPLLNKPTIFIRDSAWLVPSLPPFPWFLLLPHLRIVLGMTFSPSVYHLGLTIS